MQQLYFGYRFDGLVDQERDEPAKHDGKHELNIHQVAGFVTENVTKYPEIRICDALDRCVMHIVNQSLVFPMPEGCTTQNRWDSRHKKFLEPSTRG